LRALRYHAGLTDDERRANQKAFVNERADIVVATVAFGMGIDRSNVRYVIHAGMPKSLEHYQQEAGRAGRDGLEAECLLLVSGGDYGLWKSVLASDGAAPPPGALRKLGEMYAFCQEATCRHRALVTYFGQAYGREEGPGARVDRSADGPRAARADGRRVPDRHADRSGRGRPARRGGRARADQRPRRTGHGRPRLGVGGR